MTQMFEAVLLGFVEGLTEFLPVSSTGHLLLVGHFLGFESTGKTFEVLIQLGAILAILSVYLRRLWAIALALPHDPAARRFVVGLLLFDFIFKWLPLFRICFPLPKFKAKA